jgi:hypothetical protein
LQPGINGAFDGIANAILFSVLQPEKNLNGLYSNNNWVSKITDRG